MFAVEQQLSVSEAVVFLLDHYVDSEAAQTQLAVDRAAVDMSNPHTVRRVRARMLRENTIKTTRSATEAGFLLALAQAGRDTPLSLPIDQLPPLAAILRLAGSFNTYMHWCKRFSESDIEEPVTTGDFQTAAIGMAASPEVHLDLYPTAAEAIAQLAELRRGAAASP
jgi:hypothetical protein